MTVISLLQPKQEDSQTVDPPNTPNTYVSDDYIPRSIQINQELQPEQKPELKQELLNLDVQFEFAQVPLNSEYDVLAEIVLTTFYNVEAQQAYKEEKDCLICLDSLKDKYTLTYPCKEKCTYHRNCILNYVLGECKKSTLVTKCERCPGCTFRLNRIYL